MGERPTVPKVTVPEIAGDFPRKRLFGALDEARANPVIWVCGPGGSGKTHLLTSYIKSRRLDSLWYHCDHGDTDAGSFFYYLGLGAKKYMEGQGCDLPVLSAEQTSSLSAFTYRFFEDLFRSMPEGSILVLDNLQEIHESAPLYGILLHSVSRIPRDLSLVIISRSDPPASFSGLLAARRMAVIRWHHLRFTLEEFKEASHILGDEVLTDDELSLLHRELEGWVAGLVLTLEQARHSDPGGWELPQAATKDITDFFATQVWDTAEPALKEFLLKTACFPYMTADMARQITGNPRSGKILGRLSSGNFFTLRFEPGPRYRYHNLFREFLIQRLREQLSHEEINDLKKTAAALLFQEGYPEESAELLLEEKDWEGLETLFRQSAHRLFEQGRVNTVQGWIKRVPGPVVKNNPWFLYWLAGCATNIDPGRQRELFEECYELFEKTGDPDGKLLAWAGIVRTYLHGQKDLDQLDRLIEDFGDLGPCFANSRDDHVRHMVAVSMLIAITFRQPGHPDALQWERLATGGRRVDTDLNTYVTSGLTVALRRYFTGNVAGFGAELRGLQNHIKDPERLLPDNRALYYTLLSTQSWLSFNLEECLTHARAGLRYSEETSGTTRWDGLLLGQQINGWLSQGELPEARKGLELYRSITDKLPPLSVSYYHQRMAWYCLACGDLEEAMTNAIEGQRQAVQAGIPHNLGYALIVRAEAHLALGEFEDVKKVLEEAWQGARALENEIMFFQCGLIEARLYYKAGDEAAGDRSLADALGTGRRNGIRNWQFLPHEEVTELLVTALKRQIETRYVSELIRLWDMQPSGDLADMEVWPWPLKVYTLGRFEILREGEPLRFTEGKVQHKPLELFKAIISLGGRSVAVERIIEILWPDSAGDAGQRNVETNLHRLRKLLGIKNAVLLKNNSLTLNPGCCWVDLWAFERAASSSEAILFGKDSRRMKNASKLYRGDFLPNDDTQGWTIYMRDRLQNRYIRLVERCGAYLEDTEELDQAIHWYMRAVELCPLSESLYSRLMHCCDKAGRKGDAIRTYHSYRRIFSAAYGISPSKPIRDLHKRLLS